MVSFKYTGDPSLKAALEELQHGLAAKQFSDELKRMGRRGRLNKTNITRDRGNAIMVKTLRALTLRIDGDLKHSRPHLHVDYGRNFRKASYAIDDGTRIAGSLASKYDKTVREWIARNRKLLNRAWRDITGGTPSTELVLQLRVAE